MNWSIDKALLEFHRRYAGGATRVFGDGHLSNGRSSYHWLADQVTGFTEKDKDGEPSGPTTVRATDWEPYEVSIVSIPADASEDPAQPRNAPGPREDPGPATSSGRSGPTHERGRTRPSSDSPARQGGDGRDVGSGLLSELFCRITGKSGWKMT